jgi:hypothetical protein
MEQYQDEGTKAILEDSSKKFDRAWKPVDCDKKVIKVVRKLQPVDCDKRVIKVVRKLQPVDSDKQINKPGPSQQVCHLVSDCTAGVDANIGIPLTE